MSSFTTKLVTNVSHLSPKCHTFIYLSIPTSTNAVIQTLVSLTYHSSITYITFYQYVCFHRKSSASRETQPAERRETIPQTQQTHPSRAQQRRSTRKANALPTHPQARNGRRRGETQKPPSAPPRATRAAGGVLRLSPRRRARHTPSAAIRLPHNLGVPW